MPHCLKLLNILIQSTQHTLCVLGKDTPLGSLLVHDSVTAFSASDVVTRLYFILCVAFCGMEEQQRLNMTQKKSLKRGFSEEMDMWETWIQLIGYD